MDMRALRNSELSTNKVSRHSNAVVIHKFSSYGANTVLGHITNFVYKLCNYLVVGNEGKRTSVISSKSAMSSHVFDSSCVHIKIFIGLFRTTISI